MKIVIGRKGKKNKVHSLRVQISDRHARPTVHKQFSIVGAASLEDAFDVVLAGTRREIVRRMREK